MRSRFFLTILSVLLFVTVGSLFFYSVILRKERFKLIDRQIRQMASSLLDSGVGDFRRIDYDRSDELLTAELGISQTRKFFIIRDGHGAVVFESAGARGLPLAGAWSGPQWFQFSINGKYVRGVNLELPRLPDRTLQVGLIFDPEVLRGDYFNWDTALFIFSIILVGLVASYLLTSYLLKPISRLDRFLSEVISISNLQQRLPSVPKGIAGDAKISSADEFTRVVMGLSSLITKVNKSHQISRQWTYQMAHELKTPLSLLSVGLERLQKKHELPEESLNHIRTEIGKVSDTINSFLGWAELENSHWQKQLHVNHISEMIAALLRRFPDRKRLVIKLENELIVSANPQHLEQLLQNLLHNALKHTGDLSPVNIELSGHSLCISDRGPGISPEVLKRMGEPFNKGNAGPRGEQGQGLGLAWANSICRIYGWKLDFTNTEPGLRVTVDFDGDAIIQPLSMNPSSP